MNNLIKLKAKKDNAYVRRGQVVEGQIIFESLPMTTEMTFCFYYDNKWLSWPLRDFEPA